MEAKQLRELTRECRIKGAPLRCIVDGDTGQEYLGLGCRRDDYGNAYGMLTVHPDVETDADGNVSGVVPFIDAGNVSALDDDSPIYMEHPGAPTGFTDLEELEPGKYVAASYALRRCGLPKKEQIAFLAVNAVQAALFCLLGAIPLLFGSWGSVEAAYGAFRLDFGIGGAWNAAVATISGLALLLCMSGFQTLVTPKEQKDAFKKKQHQGPLGEVFQLPVASQLLFFALTGIGEEVLFRLGIMSTLMSVSLAMGVDIVSAAITALLASSAIFAAAHAGSYKLPELAVVFASGAVLGLVWLLSGSLVAAIAVHGLYDLTASLSQLPAMRRDAGKYFFGKRPNAILSRKLDPGKSEDSYEIVF